MKVQLSTPKGRITELHLPQFIDQLSADHFHRNPSSPSAVLPILLGRARFQCDLKRGERGGGAEMERRREISFLFPRKLEKKSET